MTWINPPKPDAGAQPAAVVEPAPTQPPPPAAAQPPPPPVEAGPAEPERTINVKTSHWAATFSNRGAVPVSWKLLQLKVDGQERPITATDGSPLELIPEVGLKAVGAPLRLQVPGDDAATQRLNDATYRVEAKGGEIGPDGTLSVADDQTVELAFTTADPTSNQTITKRYSILGGSFGLGMSVDSSAGALPLALFVGPRIGDQSVKTEGTYAHTPPHAIVVSDAAKVYNVAGGEVKDGQQKVIDGLPRWAGITDNYFAMVVADVMDRPAQSVVFNSKLKFTETEDKTHDFLTVSMPFVTGKPLYLFVGPKDPNVLDTESVRAGQVVGAPVDLHQLINYGWFAFLVRPIIPVIDAALRATHRLVGNYGWSIVIVTALFNLLFFPLRYKSSVSMKRAAKLQPQMKALQEKLKKYKATDPEFKELQREQMELMKQGNPLGGCLPMLIQFPFFWAFFMYFTTSFVVRQQPWIGWVHDLTSPDPHYILPVLMCAAQIGSMMITPMPNQNDPAMKFQRQLMTWVMPIAFTYFFLVAAPSGLVLYWMTLNLVGIGIQYAINKMMPPDIANSGPGQSSDAASGKGSKKSKKDRSTSELVGSEK